MMRLPALFLALAACLSCQGRSPNVIVILSDDQGWGDFGFHGNRNLQTPNLDSLARDGARFDRFFVCPVCSPTRAEFLTGRYHLRGGVYSTSTGGERLDLDERTIAEVFRDAGYATAAFGKWHNGMQYPYHPNGRGFDEYYGFCSGHWGHYYSPMLEHNGELVRGNGFVIDDFTDRALDFIGEGRREPFFVYLAYNTPHSPMQVPDRFWERFEDKELVMLHRDGRESIDHTRAALAMCENIDWNVGRILRHLEDHSLAEDTIVVYFNDNGPNGRRWNAGMKGRKGSTDEGGVRSPLFIRWPARIRAGTEVRSISGVIDLLPTLADLAGIEVPGDRPLDGTSLEPLILEQAREWPERLIFSHWRDRTSVRSRRFRLDGAGALFDMIADPGQTRDVGQEHPGIHRRLSRAVETWRGEMGVGSPTPHRPFTVGHPDFLRTQLPARDAVAHGDIRRTANPPNCSYFTNWTSTEDHVSWDVEVIESGRFLVDIHYTCRPEDAGTSVRLRFGNSELVKRVRGIHNPPEVGAAEDRVARREAYVKDFRSLRMGVISLEKGKGEMRLEAPEIPGERSIDFRLMMLTRLPD